ncbi:MAG: hypothetical protein LLF76_12755 [Planctomycetaceae bacterium]|nr:hypothetical protein [Planctomycetaceae bacterium]
MESHWNKKRVGLLLAGQQDAVEELLNQYKPVIYTWMYYQVGADARIAADLTARTFIQALERLSEFNPNEHTLFQWLKERARASRDEGLLHWQLKAQRPWAWSQMPDPLLQALSQLRSEPLRETVAANPFVQEIVQASLAELEQADRELMMRRYSRLDTPDKIASDMNLSVEKINDRLYKCRHAFRRGFFQLIASVNPGFNESAAGSGIEMLDNNLEKLLRAAAMYQLPSAEYDLLIRDRVFEAAQKMVPSGPSASKWPTVLIAAASAAVFLLAATAVFLWLFKAKPAQNMQSAQSDKPAVIPTAVKNAAVKPQANPQDMDEEELKMVFQLGQNGNLEALLEVLKSGHFSSQLAAAHFLGKQGQPSAIALLEQAENQWYPNGPADNPFAEAIDQIIRRHPQSSIMLDKIALQAAPADVKSEVIAAQGIVLDSAERPLAGAEIQLFRNPAGVGDLSKPVAQAVSKEDGRFVISQPLQGSFILRCKPSKAEPDYCSRAIWCGKQKPAVVQFGGRTVVAGRIHAAERALSGLKLILTDVLDRDKAAFRAETVAQANGSFVFSGLRPGFYHLLSSSENQKLVRLSTLDIAGTDIAAFDLDVQPLSIIVEYPEPNVIESAKLAYQFEPLTILEEKSAKIGDYGGMRFENVLAGRYLLKAKTSSGITLQQEIEIQPRIDEQVITLEPLPEQMASLKGKATSSRAGLFLLSSDRSIQIDLPIRGDGTYELTDVPAELYSLSAFADGKLVEFTKIDLQASAEVLMDLDVEQITGPYSPFYVMVTDDGGAILSGARVWLTNGNDIFLGESNGRGAFLAAPAGAYTLQTVFGGYPPQTRQITIHKAPLTAGPSADNTILIELVPDGQ